MSGLPRLSKTWQCSTLVSTLTGSGPAHQKDLIIQVKDARVAAGHVVVGSSDGTTGARDGVDRWTSIAALPDGVNWPWMLLTQPGSGAQDLIAYQNFGQTNWRWEHSPGGLFTGGSASVLPTASDASGSLYGGLNGSIFFGNGSHTANPFICNLWISSDLKCCRQSFWYNGNPIGNVVFDVIKDPTSGIASPIAMVDKYGSSDPTGDALVGKISRLVVVGDGAGLGPYKGHGPHGLLGMFGSATGTSSGGLRSLAGCLAGVNKVSGVYRNDEAFSGLYEPYANSDGGYHGQIFDQWWVQDTAVTTLFADGSTVPSDGSKQFVIIGDLMWPWNGGAFRTA